MKTSKKPVYDRLLNKFVATDAALRTEYFGVEASQIADMLKRDKVGVFAESPDLENVRRLAGAGEHAQACKQLVEATGCEMSDAHLSVELLVEYG